VLICGFGSVGVRHASNLKTLGHEISVFDISEEARKKSVESGYNTYASLQEALDILPEIVLICSGTASHVPLCQEVLIHNSNLKGIFCEKPLSFSMEGVDTVISMCKERNIKLGCACNLRYLSGIRLIKTLLNSGNFGKIVSCEYYFGHWLPFWHNDNTWKESYSASEKGGIILDDSHSINLIEYLCGNIVESKGILYHTNLLDIKCEDVAMHIHKTDKGVICRITSDYINHIYTRNISIVCEKGNIQFEIERIEDGNIISSVCIHTPEIKEWRVFSCDQPLNSIYIDLIADYINCITNNKEFQCNGVSELKIIDNIKKEDLYK